MSFFKFICSFESLFVLWSFSYQYKNTPFFTQLPDITILLTFFLIPWGAFLYRKDKSIYLKDPLIFSFLILSLWFILTSFWSPSHGYKLQKTLCYTLYTIPSFLMGSFLIARDETRIKRLIQAFFLFSILVLGESYRVFWNNGLTTISDIFQTNYLVTGQTLGVGWLIILVYSYFSFPSPLTLSLSDSKFSKYAWLFTLFISGFFFYALLNLGGRGPLVAATLTIFVFYGSRFWKDPTSKVILHFGLFSIFCMLAYCFLNEVFSHTSSHFSHRISPLLSGEIDGAVQERVTYYQSTLQTFLHYPLIGVGLGGWPISNNLGDIHLHPHNIFLEIMSETGFIGLALFITFLYFSLKNFKNNCTRTNPYHVSIMLIALFSFLNAQKTGDLHDNLLLFLMLSLSASRREKIDSVSPNIS